MPYRLISQQMLLEHEVLARLSDALRTAIGWSHHGGVSQKLASVRFLAESFQRHLERMLELEEQEGYLELARKSHPERHTELDQFLAEHAQFRQQVQHALTRLEQLDSSSHEELEPIFAELGSLLETIDAHNKREMCFLQELVLSP
jgi:hemerythrin-like domain-containing protein